VHELLQPILDFCSQVDEADGNSRVILRGDDTPHRHCSDVHDSESGNIECNITLSAGLQRRAIDEQCTLRGKVADQVGFAAGGAVSEAGCGGHVAAQVFAPIVEGAGTH
jgi:hypothetical protein